MSSGKVSPKSRGSRWGAAGWVIIAIAPLFSFAYTLVWLPRDPDFWSGTGTPPALALAGMMTSAAVVILIAKFITGLRSGNAGRLFGVAVGWIALFTLTWPMLLPAVLPIGVLIAILALIVHLRRGHARGQGGRARTHA
jgi:hypothetical protein